MIHRPDLDRRCNECGEPIGDHKYMGEHEKPACPRGNRVSEMEGALQKADAFLDSLGIFPDNHIRVAIRAALALPNGDRT